MLGLTSVRLDVFEKKVNVLQGKTFHLHFYFASLSNSALHSSVTIYANNVSTRLFLP